MPTQSDPDIIFLGLCERAKYVREGKTNVFKWNVLGLKHVVLSHIFPIPFLGWSVGFAFSSYHADQKCLIQVVDESENEVGTINLISKSASIDSEDALVTSDGPTLLTYDDLLFSLDALIRRLYAL
jgi:hypothetical protein